MIQLIRDYPRTTVWTVSIAYLVALVSLRGLLP